MRLQTSCLIAATPETVWPWLTGSRMDVPGWFCLGLPRPQSCELPDSLGGVGAERRCISDRGVVTQRITHWQPPHKLSFIMVETTHRWAPWVEAITETFELFPHPTGTRVMRTTQLQATTPFRFMKELGFALGLKRVHYYVYRNWKAAALAV